MKHVAMFPCVTYIVSRSAFVAKYIDFRNVYDVSNINYEPMFRMEYCPELIGERCVRI
jgi:hypothetical protein